ncbi:hypothetical protein [Bacillus sp. 1NLA3E]|uniref:hypothetical protein n=1 Tax=Bacillus sp. 1NLA3E TaxID=666686 RepID=UPI000247ECD1|nr:hypothetical protein [Bacillus sp. 1NLA3E]
MLLKNKEVDFYQIKSVSLGRLSPNNVSGFFWGGFVLSTVTTIVAFAGISTEISTFMTLMVLLSLFLWVFQFFFTLFFTMRKIAYKFQRLLSVYLSLIGFKVSIDFYQAFFGVCEVFNSPSYIKTTGTILFLGGIILLIISTMRAVRRVKQGELRKEGRGLYNFQNSKGYVSVPIIFGVTMLGGAAARFFSDMSTDITALAILFFAVLLQYSVAMALPEFFLLTYCKFRFESFKVKMPK